MYESYSSKTLDKNEHTNYTWMYYLLFGFNKLFISTNSVQTTGAQKIGKHLGPLQKGFIYSGGCIEIFYFM